MIVRDEIENVFFEIRAGAGRCSALCRWRIISASERPSSAVLMAPASVIIILPPPVEMRDVGFRGVDQRRRR